MAKKKTDESQETTGNSTSRPLLPALPPPDDPLRRSTDFDPDREYKSREMAEKRLEAIKKTRKMPTANEESSAQDGPAKDSDAKSDSS